MKLIFTDAARNDLFRIGNWIAEEDPVRALSFIEELEERCYALVDFPKAFAVLPNRKASGIRRAVHGNYSIFYSVSDAVYILHVLNSAMDYERILFPEA